MWKTAGDKDKLKVWSGEEGRHKSRGRRFQREVAVLVGKRSISYLKIRRICGAYKSGRRRRPGIKFVLNI